MPWSALTALLFTVVIFLAASTVAALIISIYPALQHWTNTQANDWLKDSIGVQFVFTLLAYGLMLGAVYAFVRQYKAGWRDIGLERPCWRDLGYALLALPVYYFIAAAALALTRLVLPGLDLTATQEVGFQSARTALSLAAAFVSLVIIPPFVEEVLMRGFLYGSLKQSMVPGLAAVITSVLFAAAHLGEGSGGLLWTAAIQFFFLSLVLIYLREKTGSLWAPIWLHVFNNFLAFGSIFLWHIR